ncbi:MAG: phosphotransferase, partial [Bacteroidales bacterium]|nr:phosphotransferase [Bacteroidales bacterium]
RDFQSRNIMVIEDQLYFIDYQGGRKGPLQYDLVSLLFQARASMSHEFRDQMLDYYIESLNKVVKFNEDKFRNLYRNFILIRLLQVLGAYGFRGYYERKDHFVSSLEYAVKNIKWFLTNKTEGLDLPHLFRSLEIAVSRFENTAGAQTSEDQKLTVEISSFSYKKGIPIDRSGNGGGFVFDCRALPNPGREEKYRNLTGLDKPVIDFLESKEEVKYYFENVTKLINQSIHNYTTRKFTHLMVNFGCTGGQHRSAYCAEKLSDLLSTNKKIHIKCNHTNLK